MAVLAAARTLARDVRHDRSAVFSLFRYSRDVVDFSDFEAMKSHLQLNLDYGDGLAFTISLHDEV
ncbi:hypothetical protein [Streptosporangium sp. NPDC050280]|uniref:hypothetical protein n=1 Tax=unclassified Streptosporangium TaxID=2632669 RepID=UPI003447AFDC